MAFTVDLSGVTLETKRLLLRPFEEGDLRDFNRYASVPGVGEMAGWPPHKSLDESKAILQMFIASKRELAIVHKQDGKVIGSMGLHPSWISADERYQHLRVLEVGYVLARDYWGQGLMPEAVQAVLAYGFDALGLGAFTCGHFTHNDQSRRVIEKAGFRYFDQEVYHAELLGAHYDLKRYLLMREAYLGKGQTPES